MLWMADQKTLVMADLPGIDAQISIGGKVRKLSTDKPLTAGGITVRLLSEDESLRAYSDNGQLVIDDRYSLTEADKKLGIKQIKTHKGLREVKIGSQKVAEQPSDADYENAAVWKLSKVNSLADDDIVSIDYAGDVARVYADGLLVQDNQWNGSPMLVRASQLRGHKVEVKILPLGKDYPIYLQPEQREVLANATDGILCQLNEVTIWTRR